ncbi:MAG: hypothetical protein WA999_17415, partial [Spirulinaceae cyanobacterium]
MFQSEMLLPKIGSLVFWLGQVIVEPDPETAEEASLIFSGPEFFMALIAGLVLAFAFQLLLTNLGVATGISLAGGSSDSDSDSGSSDSLGSTIRKIGFALGLATLISVTISLFFACLLAVKLSFLEVPLTGAILGLVIWATYFCLLVWVSSTTVGSLVGSVVNTATSGFQALVGTAAAAIGGNAASNKVVATAEAAASAVRRELASAVDPDMVREKLEDYLGTIRPAQLDLQQVGAEMESLLNDPKLQEITDADSLRDVDRQTFIDLVSDRSDLSKRETEKLAATLESVWRKTVDKLPQRRDPLGELVDYVKSAAPTSLVGDDFTNKLGDLVDELRQSRTSQESDDSTGPISQALTTGMNSLVGMVMGRTDLSDLDAEKIAGQLRRAKNQLTEKGAITSSSGEEKDSLVKAEIENYILNAYSWQLKPGAVEREFRDVIYDPDADPEAVAEELEQFSRSDFVDLLQEKGLYTQDKVKSIANLLESIRLEALATAQAAQEREAQIVLLAEVEQYLLSAPKEELTPEKIQLNFKPILEDSDADHEQLNSRLTQFDLPTFERILEQRSDLEPYERAQIIIHLEEAKGRVLQESQETLGAAKAKADEQWRKVQSYLRDTGKNELNPQAIEQELKLLLNDPQAGMSALRQRASRFDRNTLAQLLTQRNDLSEEQVHQTIEQVERNWTRIRRSPKKLAGKAQEQYDKATSAITDYLRNTGKAELNPEGIKRDVAKLFDDPQAGGKAIQRRIATMDRDTLVQLLNQRDDLDEAQINQVIDEVQGTLRSMVKAPRRLANRAQAKVQDFQGTVAEYLRSTDKAELSPEGIKYDLQLLLNDPRLGAQSLQQRLAAFDRSTIVALLSQREDISEADVNRIVDNIVEVRDQFLDQFKMVQSKLQSIVDSIFERIRAYL